MLRGCVTNLGAILCATVLGIHAVSAAAQVPESTEPVIEAVRERVEALSAVGRLSIEGASLTATGSLATLYELHGFQPFWDSANLGGVRALRVHVLDLFDLRAALLCCMPKIIGGLHAKPRFSRATKRGGQPDRKLGTDGGMSIEHARQGDAGDA
jgi:hypothetical protein